MLRIEDADLLIGVDDTDNLESRGTGHLVQRLMAWLPGDDLGRPCGATRHQFLVDPRIPYTSHNSGACIAWASCGADVDRIIDACAWFLRQESASGSDPGLAVLRRAQLEDEGHAQLLVEHGRRAKTVVLHKADAIELAARTGVHLSEHGGDGGGVIGALAAVGLHLGGQDGFFLWMPVIRDLPRILRYGQLRSCTTIDAVDCRGRAEPRASDLVSLSDWVRPVLADHRSILLLEPVPHQESLEGESWRVAPKAVVKAYGS